MTKYFLPLIVFVLFCNVGLWAQQGVGTTTPNPSAALEIVSPDKGLLIPRLMLTTSSTFAPISGNPNDTHNGLLIYNTSTATETTPGVSNGLYGPGYYYWNGESNGSWIKIATEPGQTGGVTDGDGDTKMDVEATDDEDIIRFYTGDNTEGTSTNYFAMNGRTLETLNNGRSVFIGEGAGANDDLTDKGNVFIGYNAGTTNTTGGANTANGTVALLNNTTGNNNTANGNLALYNNITGNNNTASGRSALFTNKAGSNGTAIGFESQRYVNETESGWNNSNVSVGYMALRGSSTAANNTGNANTAVGYEALLRNTTGGSNMASGSGALNSNTTGSNNVANGSEALRLNTTGNANTANGRGALRANTTGNNNTANGYYAGRYINDGGNNRTSSNSVYLGYDTRASLSGNTNEIVIGATAEGIGSNTAVLGNDDIVTTALKGQVGIGTTTPSETLTISGTLGLTGHLYDTTQSSGTLGQVLTRGATGTLWGSGGGGVTDDDGDTSITAVDTDGDGAIDADQLEFQVGGTNQLIINSTGNLQRNITDNTITDNSTGNVILAPGLSTITNANQTTIAGGNRNIAENLARGFMGGGLSNTISSSTEAAIVAGGDNTITSGYRSFIGGGNANTVSPTSAHVVIAGGSRNSASGHSAAILGGRLNIATGDSPAVLGGYNNQATAWRSAVAGGQNNIASGALAFIGAGADNVAIGNGANVSGRGNTGASFGEWVGGLYTENYTTTSTDDDWLETDRIFAVGNGTSDTDRSNALTILKNGNVGIGTTTPSETLTISGTLGLTGHLYDSTQSSGTLGQVLTRGATGTLWGSGGGGVTDDDGDTKMDVEATDDEDIIRFYTGDNTEGTSTNYFAMNGRTLETLNTGGSVFIGEGAGANDDLMDNANVFIGKNAGATNTTGNNNTANGNNALYSNTTGNSNVANGSGALYANIMGRLNIAIGRQALSSSKAGSQGVAIGYQSQQYANDRETAWTNTNVSVGYQALRGSTAAASNTGYANTAVGHLALLNNVSGNSNVAIGKNVLRSNVNGNQAVAIGMDSQRYRTTGTQNVAVGAFSLLGNATNTASNTGIANVAIGYWALESAESASTNAAVGGYALNNLTDGDKNAALGIAALGGMITGNNNVAVGWNAGNRLVGGGKVTGTNNSIYIGSESKGFATDQVNEIVIGANAEGIGSNTVVLGNNSIVTTALKGNVGIGTTTPSETLTVSGTLGLTGHLFDTNQSSGTQGQVLTRGANGILWGNGGGGSGGGSVSDGDGDTKMDVEATSDEDIIRFYTGDNTGTSTNYFALNGHTLEALNTGGSVFIGEGAGANDDLTDNANVFIGKDAGATNTTGGYNTANGNSTLYANTTGTGNVANGNSTLYANTTGDFNIAMGNAALRSNKGGSNGTAIGHESQRYVDDKETAWTNRNVSVGYQALRGSTTPGSNTGNSNSALGYQALMNNTLGNQNTAMGQGALYANTAGNFNTAVGEKALHGNTQGYQNTANGMQAGSFTNTGSFNQTSNNSVYLGYNTRASLSGSTNEIVIGSLARGNGSNSVTLGNDNITKTVLKGNVGIGTAAPTEALDVVGNIKVSGSITPDYVFEKYYEGESALKADYEMMSLAEIERFTRANKHLPGVPSAKEVSEKGGIVLNRATEINLEKIEELYLHLIEQQKQIEVLKARLEALETN